MSVNRNATAEPVGSAMAGTHHGSDATASSAGQTSLAFLPPGTMWAAYDAAMDDARRTWFRQNLLTERARLVVEIEDARPRRRAR